MPERPRTYIASFDKNGRRPTRSSLERARLHATLEQRVADRTADLAASLERLQNTQTQLVDASRTQGSKMGGG